MPLTPPAPVPAAPPPLRGTRGAVAAAHPDAAAAASAVLRRGGNAVDAAIAASAVICLVMPQAASLGGDLLALVRRPDATTVAVNGTGTSASSAPADSWPSDRWSTGGGAVTVPGLVAAWAELHDRFGSLPLARALAPAVSLAREGVAVDGDLAAAVGAQRDRLLAGGAADWALLDRRPGQNWRQPALARLLESVGREGPNAFYTGPAAAAVAEAVRRSGGWLDEDDLGRHTSVVGEPVTVPWAGAQVHVQPPSSQGVLLAMALHHLERCGPAAYGLDPREGPGLAHLLVELTEAAFGSRADCAAGEVLLDRTLEVDPQRAAGRGGPRAYLHTAGVAVADADGWVVSSLVSVFDDFGSGVHVPELGLTLNNRAAGFTDGANAPGPGRRPVHTLAPALVEGDPVLALATPGADGQVQTLLQLLAAVRYRGLSLAEAVAALRWRTEDGSLLVEAGHPDHDGLVARGHRVVDRPAGDPVFGGVVAAGVDVDGPFCVADWRRQVAAATV
ncbi:gamma-glutamyltransferase [uncultured Friedmanniella sp.]|uniref:gamma-glutamyltransferase n=1 Tax=uncultured Friedmanniella sp. TaxID=335381 RepID=UPI0035CACCF7